MGVTWLKRDDRWRAQIFHDGRVRPCGTFHWTFRWGSLHPAQLALRQWVGVTWLKRDDRWRAQIFHDGRVRPLWDCLLSGGLSPGACARCKAGILLLGLPGLPSH